MEIVLLAGVIVGWSIGAVMVAALVSDFRSAGTRGRAWMVLVGGVLITLGPMIAEALERRHFAIDAGAFALTLTFGIAATLMYAVVLIATALVRLYRRCLKRRRTAA